MSTDMNTQIGEKIKPLRSNREVFEPAPTSNKTTLRILEIKGDPSDIGQIKIRMLDQFGKELLVSSRFPANAASKTSIDSQSRIKNLPSSPKGSSILAHHKSISDLMNTTPMQQKTKVLWIANFGERKVAHLRNLSLRNLLQKCGNPGHRRHEPNEVSHLSLEIGVVDRPDSADTR
jgi:hypothetical protein